MGLREVGGGEWIMASNLEDGEIALDKAKFRGFGENDNGTFCIFSCPERGQVNVGGRTLITACESVDVGDIVRVVYEGQKKFNNGRKGAMWKLFIYDEEEDGSTDDVSGEDEPEDKPPVQKKKAKRKAKKATKKVAKKTTRKKKVEEVEEVEEEPEDDLDELDELE